LGYDNVDHAQDLGSENSRFGNLYDLRFYLRKKPVSNWQMPAEPLLTKRSTKWIDHPIHLRAKNLKVPEPSGT
jgi:hypothetical protein